MPTENKQKHVNHPTRKPMTGKHNRNNRNNRNKPNNNPLKSVLPSLELTPEVEVILAKHQEFIDNLIFTNERLLLENKKLQEDRDHHVKVIKKLRSLAYGKPTKNGRNKKGKGKGKNPVRSPYTMTAPHNYKQHRRHLRGSQDLDLETVAED